jgi:hypothetical protein
LKLSFPFYFSKKHNYPLFTTMLLSSTIIATLVGFASAAAFSRDDNSGFKTLSQAVISTLTPYANYAAAAMCGIENLQTWDCGCACLTCDPSIFSGEGRGREGRRGVQFPMSQF